MADKGLIGVNFAFKSLNFYQILNFYMKINENMMVRIQIHLKSGQCRCFGCHFGIAIRMKSAS